MDLQQEVAILACIKRKENTELVADQLGSAEHSQQESCSKVFVFMRVFGLWNHFLSCSKFIAGLSHLDRFCLPETLLCPLVVTHSLALQTRWSISHVLMQNIKPFMVTFSAPEVRLWLQTQDLKLLSVSGIVSLCCHSAASWPSPTRVVVSLIYLLVCHSRKQALAAHGGKCC